MFIIISFLIFWGAVDQEFNDSKVFRGIVKPAIVKVMDQDKIELNKR